MMRSLLPVTALAALLLSACSGFKSNEASVLTYVLRPALPAPLASSAPNADATLTVLVPVAAPGLESEHIMLLQGSQRLDWYRDARWSGELPRLVQSSIIDALRAAGRFATVSSEEAPFESTYLLQVEIRHFEADYSAGAPPTVKVELIATLGRRVDRTVLLSTSASAEVRADADHLQSVGAAFQSALAQALAGLAKALQPPAP
jgi:cholesterol transport system auxiliary component